MRLLVSSVLSDVNSVDDNTLPVGFIFGQCIIVVVPILAGINLTDCPLITTNMTIIIRWLTNLGNWSPWQEICNWLLLSYSTLNLYELKSGKNIMFTFAIWTIIVNVYVIFLFILHFHFIIRNYHEMRICSFFIASLSFDKSTALANFISLMKVWSAKSRKLFFWLEAIKIWIMMLR